MLLKMELVGRWGGLAKKKSAVMVDMLDYRLQGGWESVHENTSGFAVTAFIVNALNREKRKRGDVLSYFHYPQQDLVGWDTAIAKPNSNPAAQNALWGLLEERKKKKPNKTKQEK